jgi:nucleoid-associated protein YejK
VLLKKYEILSINDVLNNLKGAYSPKVKYWISKNKKILADEVKSLESAKESESEDFKAFSKEQTELLKSCIEYDKDGQPVLVGTGYKIASDRIEQYKEGMKALEELHSVGLEERRTEIDALNLLLQEETDIDAYLLDSAEIPESIDQSTYDILFPLIK